MVPFPLLIHAGGDARPVRVDLEAQTAGAPVVVPLSVGHAGYAGLPSLSVETHTTEVELR